MESADLKHRFQYHQPPDKKTVISHGLIRESCLKTAFEINLVCPDGREKSTAITKLEEAMFWANAAIARGPGN